MLREHVVLPSIDSHFNVDEAKINNYYQEYSAPKV